ncbi:MAG: hypothetical protein ACKOXM_04790 [Agromyces sp.]
MAKNANESESAREVTPDELAPETPIVPAAEPQARSASRRGVLLGGGIAAGALALALSFGGGYAVGHASSGAEFSQGGHGQFGPDAQQGFGGHGDRDGDRDGQFSGGMPGQDGQLPGGLPGQDGQMAPPAPGATPTPTS